MQPHGFLGIPWASCCTSDSTKNPTFTLWQFLSESKGLEPETPNHMECQPDARQGLSSYDL
ncbi:hypothetical protein LEMLEM_LOCUS7791 [Lemmus lemmus]